MEINDLKNESQLLIERLTKENELKTKWLSLIAHDFKGMFYNINFLLNALEDKMISQEQFQCMLPELKQISEKNLKTLESTFAWINQQTDSLELQREDVLIYQLLLDLKEHLNQSIQQKNLVLKYSGDEHITLSSDKLLLSFILKHTIENAIKYSNKNGIINFTTRLENDAVCIEIQDNGIGMTNNVLNNIFTLNGSPFKGTMDEKGAGLSLIVVKDFVEVLGGNMEILSKPNEGTTVKFLFKTNL